MVDIEIEKPIHRGNQAFIDEDYPATLEVLLYAVFSSGGARMCFLRLRRLVRRSRS